MMTTPRTAPASRGISRQTLLTTAAELFARKGYRATTLDDIASELGLKKASLYHYIGSKDELLADIYAEIFDRIEAAVAPLASLPLPVDERLRRMIHAHLAVVCSELPSLSVVFSEESELPAESQRRIRRRKRAHDALFEDVIAQGQAAGVFRPGSPKLKVVALLGMCNWVYKWLRPQAADPAIVEEIAAEFALIFETGIKLATDGGASGAANGAWPRFASLDEAFGPAGAAIDRMRGELDRLAAELAEAKERLRDGLAGGVGSRPETGNADPAAGKRGQE
jgi:AcrR family transcriptional regulator